jgi:nucleotide-binding universal stress UspA family protein
MSFRSLFIPALEKETLAGSVADAGVLLEGPAFIEAHFATDDYKPPVSMAQAVNLSAMIEEQRAVVREHEAVLSQTFAEASAGLGEQVFARFSSSRGEVTSLLARASRACDAILYRHRGADKRVIEPALLEQLLFRSGKPLFLVPDEGLKSRPAKLAVAWNGSREAARALALAAPLVQSAEEVQFICVGEEKPGTPTIEEMAEHLQRCGTEAKAIRRPAGRKVSRTIAELAEEEGAQALILGAFSHSRLREVILGGVTRTVLEEPPMPLLIAH